VSVLFLGEVAGIIGAIVAVPVVAALQIILREILRERRQQLDLQRSANQLIATPGETTSHV
jgi:predicted PurR-regulated permease PerM